MKNYARVVVIGGGIAGCSTLYHLTKLGCSDVVLVEKNELTSGSTWLAAGNVPHYHRSFNTTKINNYAVQLYPTLEEETGLPVTVTDAPLSTVALGSGQTLDSIEILKQVVIT